MKKNVKKLLSAFLAAVMILSAAPLTGFTLLDFGTKASALSSSGSCGDNVTYTFDEDTGLLTISGTGKMRNYALSYSPFYDFYSNISIKSVVINYGVTSIGDCAFYNCTRLTSVTIPDSVTSIGFYAFDGCTGLASVTIGNSVTSIGGSAFYNCTGLTSIAIPDSVTSIGDYAFCGCTGLTSISIPDSVTSIGGSAFYNCTGLTSVTIPNSVTSIGGSAFYNCTGLTSIAIPDSVTSIGYRAFYHTGYYNNSGNWEDDVLYIGNHLINANKISGSYAIKSGTITIANNAFYSFERLTNITIPDSVISIGDSAFSCCTGLTSITIPNSVTSIGDNAFGSCKGLTSVTIGNSVTSIGDFAFGSCTGLTSVTIPDSVKRIEESAFAYCTGLTSITIPNSVTSIGDNAFDGCKGLTSITIGNSVKSIGDYAFWGCTKLKSITIPDSVTSIGRSAFSGCTGLTGITIPDSVTSISWAAFGGCTSLTSITIPDSVTGISNWAFSGCSGLTSVTIPDSVTSIGYGVFAKCIGLTSITVDTNNKVYDCRENCNAIIETETNALIQGCKSTTIPDSVTSISGGAFYGCTGLTGITIPDSVTSIVGGAFEYCTGLTSITIPDSVTSIGDSAFLGCKGLTSITIPDSVTSIGDSAFWGCTGLTSITIPNSVTSIGKGVFGCCTGLTSITIPDSVTRICEAAFQSCTGLTSVTIPNSVTSIGESAFQSCTGLTSVTIPNSVTSIGESAFRYCTALKDVYYNGSEKEWKNIYIDNSYSANTCLTNATIHFNSGYHELKFSQTHTISGYGKNNAAYSGSYLSGTAKALDGVNSSTEMIIPGLRQSENMVPQGLAYYPAKNQVLISSYFKTEKKEVSTQPSMIFALNFSTGLLEEEYEIRDSNGKAIYGHVGGIAVSGNNVYVANGKYIYCIPSSNFNTADKTAKAIGKYKVSDLIGGAECSYVTITDGVLWTGNFYDEDEDYNTPASESHNSAILGFKLSGSGDESEWNSFNGSSPDYKYYPPDSIENIQCATVTGGKLIMATSYGRKNESTVYMTNVSESTKLLVMSDIFSVKAMPLMEGFFIKDGYMYNIFESGAYYYYGKTPTNISKSPTDVVWKTDLGLLLGNDSTAVTENDVIDKYVPYVIDGKNCNTTVNFKQAYFNADSSSYNHSLAQLCSQYVTIGYDDGDKLNLSAALEAIGMSDIVINPRAGREEVNYFLANRKVNCNGKEYTLIFAGFIGSYHEQWYSNFDPGTGSVHKGFNNAKKYAYNELNEYISALGIDKNNTKILITGHSRGAATANLLAAQLIKDENFASKENIYTYTFATPNTTTLSQRNNAEYKRIFNIVNPEDFVTKVMLNSWGYGRYGTTYVLPSKTNTAGYSSYKDNMQVYFSKLTGGHVYHPFREGEAYTYAAVKELGLAVPSVSLYYDLPLFAGTIPVTPYYFFQNTLCHLVSSVASVADNALALTLISQTFGYTHSNPAYRNILQYFIYGGNGVVSDQFIDAHRAETYSAYMLSMVSSDMKYRSGYMNSVNCPVDIEIYDKETDELVGKITNNVVDEEIAAKENSVVMNVDGDSKQFWLPSDGNYNVILKGNDEGTMDYTVSAVDEEGNETARTNFFDVEINTETALTAEVDGEDFDIDGITLDSVGKESITPTQTTEDAVTYDITLDSDGNGTVSDSLKAISGDYVTVCATANEGYIFNGWYNGEELVSEDAEYSFVAKQNTALTAKFKCTLSVKSVSISDMDLNFKSTAALDILIGVDAGVDFTLSYSSSDPSVAKVDVNGNVYGAKRGSADITVTVTDEYGNTLSSTCKVNVKYTWWQWIIKILLFGWIWYN